jgi:hypothetical protein
MNGRRPGLGRRFAPDYRDKNYPVRTLIEQAPKELLLARRRYHFSQGWWGDQGNNPYCVGYGWTHWIEDGPVTHGGEPPCIDPVFLYREAQKVDEWPGESYEGTSVRAGAKVLQALGFISGYRWASNFQEWIDTILSVGPVVIGVNWYDDMFDPDPDGKIHIGGSLAGGHCIKSDAVNMDLEVIRLKNSWGRFWGVGGFCYISFKDAERLQREDGEICLATEVAK